MNHFPWYSLPLSLLCLDFHSVIAASRCKVTNFVRTLKREKKKNYKRIALVKKIFRNDAGNHIVSEESCRKC